MSHLIIIECFLRSTVHSFDLLLNLLYSLFVRFFIVYVWENTLNRCKNDNNGAAEKFIPKYLSVKVEVIYDEANHNGDALKTSHRAWFDSAESPCLCLKCKESKNSIYKKFC